MQVLHRAASATWFAGQTTRGNDAAIARLIRRRVSSTAMLISGGGALHTSAAETALNAPLFTGRRSPTTCIMLFGAWLFSAAESAPSSLVEGRCCAVAALCRIFSARANERLPAALLERFILLARTLLARTEHDRASDQVRSSLLLFALFFCSSFLLLLVLGYFFFLFYSFVYSLSWNLIFPTARAISCGARC